MLNWVLFLEFGVGITQRSTRTGLVYSMGVPQGWVERKMWWWIKGEHRINLNLCSVPVTVSIVGMTHKRELLHEYVGTILSVLP